jgi:hypothetical protein
MVHFFAEEKYFICYDYQLYYKIIINNYLSKLKFFAASN